MCVAVAKPDGVCFPFLLGSFLPSAPHSPPSRAPVEDGSGCSAPRQNMRGCCLEAAASQRRWLPVKNMSSRPLCAFAKFCFCSLGRASSPCPPLKRLSLFHTDPCRPDNEGRGCGSFSQPGARKVGSPATRSAATRRRRATLCSRRRGAGGLGGGRLKPHPRSRPPCFAESCCLPLPFLLSLKTTTKKYKVST